MTIEEARTVALAELDNAKAMNASYEHPESAKRVRFATVILDLAAQLEIAQARVAELEAKPRRKR